MNPWLNSAATAANENLKTDECSEKKNEDAGDSKKSSSKQLQIQKPTSTPLGPKFA